MGRWNIILDNLSFRQSKLNYIRNFIQKIVRTDPTAKDSSKKKGNDYGD